MDARIAAVSGPRWNHTSRRVVRSAATAVNGIGSSSICSSPRMPSIFSITRLPRTAPGSVKPAGSISRSTPRWVRVRTQVANSSSRPAATSPPTSAPIDVPATATISWPRSRSSSTTPRCAYPRAPPAPSTSATLTPPL